MTKYSYDQQFIEDVVAEFGGEQCPPDLVESLKQGTAYVADQYLNNRFIREDVLSTDHVLKCLAKGQLDRLRQNAERTARKHQLYNRWLQQQKVNEAA